MRQVKPEGRSETGAKAASAEEKRNAARQRS